MYCLQYKSLFNYFLSTALDGKIIIKDVRANVPDHSKILAQNLEALMKTTTNMRKHSLFFSALHDIAWNEGIV
jgi:hypothetical protein